jgi:hypothetical protein
MVQPFNDKNVFGDGNIVGENVGVNVKNKSIQNQRSIFVGEYIKSEPAFPFQSIILDKKKT